MASEQNIVILGGSYSGINSAHYLLKFVLPTLKTKNSYRVVLVSPSDEFYHRMAAPRAILSKELYPESKYFFNIPQSFQQYDSKQFAFVQGKATSLDKQSRSVHVALTNGEEESLTYHALVIATGAASQDAVLSNQAGTAAEDHKAIQDMQMKLKSAKTVIIGGGGPAGVEVAGEIGEYFNGKPSWFGQKPPKVSIQLVTSGERLLPILRPALATQAQSMLKGVGVVTTYNTKISKTEKIDGGGTKVLLANGNALEADVYINAIGVIPNTSYLPEELLDDSGRVKTNNDTLRVDSAGARVYAVGDVGSYTRGGALEIFNSVPVMATNLKLDLLTDEGVKPTHGDRTFKGDVSETQVVTLGQSRGVGAFNGNKIPSLVIWALKGRDYMSGRVKGQAEGKHWNKEAAWKPTPLNVVRSVTVD